MDIEHTPNNKEDTEGTGKHLSLRVLVGVFILLFLSAYFAYYLFNNKQSIVKQSPVASTTPAFTPQKTDFGSTPPPDFPTDIPVEKGVKVNQSFSLNYEGQKQLTIVFLSKKTIKENYTLYTTFLKKENWTVSNKYESPDLFSLYGTKGSNDINITISTNTSTSTKSQVSVSVLRK